MQAAFLELGLERTAFLYVDDIIETPLGADVEIEDDVEDTGDGDYNDGDRDEGDENGPEAANEGHGGQGSGGGGGRGGERDRGGRGGGRGRRDGGRRGRGRFRERRPRERANIQDLLTEGQELLVQVAKAPIGTKGARLTTHISLPGRNVVLMPTFHHIGISRKIESDKERRRLRDLFTKRIRPKNVGFIIRTVAAGKMLREIKADADYLIKLWNRIQRDFKRKKAPALIHEDLSLSMRSVRDFFTDEVDSFIIDNPKEYEEVLRFIGQFMPRLKARVKLFRGPSQLFEHYGIEAEISRALGKKVWLKSGGYLLIDQSEALTSIDVNTGRYVGSKSLEETIFKTNLEAVKEISYQLRIRNVGGIIIIDLIDMESPENREKVYRALNEALGEDKAKTNILKISELGLVEMTRKRTHEDLVRYLTEPCGYCDGRGYHKSRRTVAFEIFREIEKESLNPHDSIVVFANPDVTKRIGGEENSHKELLERRLNRRVTVKTDPAFHIEQFEVFGK
ncbi:MAG: Rne/Rng family ribonuclease [Deltaproteobacteria bacterium]|nr:Rne/Rng family ribonuclease [Deltaproteobacteria bacterium]